MVTNVFKFKDLGNFNFSYVSFSVIQLLLNLLLVSFLTGCHKEHNQDVNNTKNTETFALESKATTNHFYYTGVIQPLKTIMITSPAEGVIDQMNFHYGDEVKEKQPLFTIFSDKFQTEYKTALMQFIKAKTDFNQNRSQLTESEFLFKNELISEDDFKSKQTAFYTAQLTLIQSEDALKILLKKMNLKNTNFSNLTIKDIDKINQALQLNNDSQKLLVTAPAKGVALLPMKNDNDAPKKLTQGEQVKQGDVLAMIGDVQGLMININVNEFNVNQLKIGQKVKVTGTAFPQHELQGEITAIDKQGQVSQGGMPVFPVEIIVPNITQEQQEVIHIGMSAKVEIEVNDPPALAVPMNAILDKEHSPHIKVERNKKIINVPVKVAKTTPESAIVEINLDKGDKVIVPN